MDLWRSLAGMLEVEVTSAEPERMLWMITSSGIPISGIQEKGPLTYIFQIFQKDRKKLEALCEKQGSRLRFLKKKGLYWKGVALLHRPVLVLGLFFLIVCGLWLPSRVFFVQVEGNTSIPKQQILEAAEKSGISFGTSRRKVRSEKVKNAILEEIPELRWAGVNTEGCVAILSVREREPVTVPRQEGSVSSIVAARDGYILSGTVTSGTSLFQVGQAVKEGQVLVSGYTDCGICIQVSRSEAEIMAQTAHKLEAVTPSQYTIREEPGKKYKNLSLRFGKKRINLWKDSGNYPLGCGRMYKEYCVTLPGGFSLPAALCVETIECWETVNFDLSLTAAEDSLSSFAEQYLRDCMIAGKILSKAETVFPEAGKYRMEGEYTCTEMIGRVRMEQIGDTNGKIG